VELSFLPSLDASIRPVQDAAVTKEEALKVLEDAEVVPCVSAGIADAKEVLSACLAEDIPAILDREAGCDHGKSCSPRIDLCVRPDDVPRVMAMMHARWQSLLDQEGTEGTLSDETTALADGEEPPCPACGTKTPLKDGACPECGLQLE